MTLPCLDQLLHRSRHVFDGHVGVDAVLIEQVDGVDLEPLERCLGDLLDVLRPAVQAQPAGRPVGLELEAELGGNHHLPANEAESNAGPTLAKPALPQGAPSGNGVPIAKKNAPADKTCAG